MRRGNLVLAGVALAVGILSFALVRGLRRIASAHPEPGATAGSAPDSPVVTLESARENPSAPQEPALPPTESGDRSGPPSPVLHEPCPVQGILWGFLLDPDGEPIEEAWLSFQHGSGEQHNLQPDDRGAYSIAGLAPGTWWASAGSTDYRRQEECLEIPPAPAPVRKDFVLRAYPRIDVQLVAPDGRPFFEAAKGSKVGAFDLVPVATREPPGERFYAVRGSKNNPFGVGQFWQNGTGQVSLPQGFWGSVFLEIDPPVHASLVLHHAVLETRRVETCPAVVTFTVDPATLESQLSALRLRIVDSTTGGPLSGARVTLMESRMFGEHSSDAGGEITLDSLLPGRDELRVMAEGHAWHRAKIELEPGLTTDLGELALEPEVPVSGTVSGPDGEPLEAQFKIGRLRDEGTLDLDQSWYQSSDATGRFELSGLAAARFVLQVDVQHSSPRYLPHAELLSENVIVDTRLGPIADLEIHLPRPSQVTVRWKEGTRKDLALRFLDERGLPRQWGRFYSAAPQSYALPRGRWKIEVVDSEERVVSERTFTLAGEPMALVLGDDAR